MTDDDVKGHLAFLAQEIDAYRWGDDAEAIRLKLEAADRTDDLWELNGDVMPVARFIANCEAGGFIDYDGYGHPIVAGIIDKNVDVLPSQRDKIPAGTTHILWFNR